MVPHIVPKGHFTHEVRFTPEGHFTYRRAEHIVQKSTCQSKCFFVVETVGIEPTTPCMSSMYSNHLSYASATVDIISHAAEFVKGFLKILSLFAYIFMLLSSRCNLAMLCRVICSGMF